jgi:ABC-type glycerol-3-phosphate transport system substrate-binding protein
MIIDEKQREEAHSCQNRPTVPRQPGTPWAAAAVERDPTPALHDYQDRLIALTPLQQVAGTAFVGGGGEDRPLTRRRFIAGVGALAAVPLLASCGKTAPPTATLRINLRLTAYERAFFNRAILPPFEAAHNVRVVFTSGTTDEAIGALRGGSSQADLLGIDTEILGLLIAEGWTTDLTDQRDPLRAEVIPATIAAGNVNGVLHALPYRPTTWITFYNSALLGAARVEPPTTWDGLLSAAGALRGQDGAGRVALQGATTEAVGGPAAQSLVELVWAFGGDPLTLADDGPRAAADFLARLAPALAPTSREAKFDTLTRDLATDRVALGPNWPVVAADLIQRGGKTTIAATPSLAGPGGQARVLSGQVLIVPKNAAQPQLARDFAAYLRAKQQQVAFARDLAWFPLREDAYSAAPDWQSPIATIALDALRTARALPPFASRETFDAALGTAFRQIAFEGVAPITALATAAERLRAVR